MKITEVRIKLMLGRKDKLRAFCSLTFDDVFVVRDFKVINGDKGAFVAMPSKKASAKCPKCRAKNSVQSSYCSFCGEKLDFNRESPQKPEELYVDIAHPIKPFFRKHIQDVVLDAYNQEVEKSKLPGYSMDRIEGADEEFTDV